MIFDLIQNVLSMGSARKRLERELNALRQEIKGVEIIPWNIKELDLLSLESMPPSKSSFFSKVKTGQLQTIYSEFVLAYAARDVYKGTRKGLILAKTFNKEYAYRIVAGQATQLLINSNFVGVIDGQGRIIQHRTNRILGSLEPENATTIRDIYVGDKRVASFTKLHPEVSTHDRAIQIFKELDNFALEVIVSLTALEMIKRDLS